MPGRRAFRSHVRKFASSLRLVSAMNIVMFVRSALIEFDQLHGQGQVTPCEQVGKVRFDRVEQDIAHFFFFRFAPSRANLQRDVDERVVPGPVRHNVIVKLDRSRTNAPDRRWQRCKPYLSIGMAPSGARGTLFIPEILHCSKALRKLS